MESLPTPKKNALQLILGQEAVLLSLFDFFRKHVPTSMLPLLAMPNREEQVTEETRRLLQATIVSPFCDIPCLQNVYGKSGKPVNTESLSSLVDNVVWSLVQKREQARRQGQDGRNLLCQGFVVASDELARSGAQAMRNMPSGILMMQVNNSVEYIKTSPVFRWLHRRVGDNVLRILLLHCSIFVPIGTERENYLQIAGPPLRIRSKLETPTSTTTVRRKRKRRRGGANSSDNLPSKLIPSATIMKNPLLYSNSHVPRVGLPTNHRLHQCNPNELLGDMVDLRDSNGKVNKKRWKRLRQKGLLVCESIIRNHKKCDYARLLEHYCPIPQNLKGQYREKADLASASAGFTSTNQVVSFLKAVLKRVFSENVWGCSQNQTRVMQLVERFVHARRQEHFTNSQLVHGLRIKEMAWLRSEGGKKFSRSNHDATRQLTLLVVRWTLEKFVIPLLNACFHVTETEFAGRRLVYYRKPVWVFFRALSMKKLLSRQYKEIPPLEAATRQQKQRMGFSCLRLVPKETGIRPIATLSKSTRIIFDDSKVALSSPNFVGNEDGDIVDKEPFPKRPKIDEIRHKRTVREWAPSTNSLLNSAFAALRFEYERDHSLFGTGLDGLHHFYPRYRRFIQQANPRLNKETKLFLGSVDIRHCFDSINQEKMLAIVASILKEQDYCIQSHTQYRPFESMSRVVRLKKTNVGRLQDIQPFHELARELAMSSHRTVYTDLGNCSIGKCDQLRSLIKEHLMNHLVVTSGRHGDRYLLQSSGVPQGSTLSTLLCNFYYGNIESRLLRGLYRKESADNAQSVEHLLCRQVDDFLFIGTHRHLLQRFLSALLEGDPALGIQVNENKTQVSTAVKVQRREGTIETLKPLDSRRSFPWCGMLLNVSTGEVMMDYSRFYADKAGCSISIDRSRGEGEEMLSQLKSFVRPRCIPILYDRCINSPYVQHANLVQMMAFAAVKLMIYVRARGVSMGPNTNISFIIWCIESAISYAGALIRSRLASVKAECDISPARHKQIGWKTFRRVLTLSPEAKAVVDVIALSGLSTENDEAVDVICRRALRSMHLGKLIPLQNG